MKQLKRTVIEIVALSTIGLIVAVAVNGVRAKGSIALGKDYFYIPTLTNPPTGDAETLAGGVSATKDADGMGSATPPTHAKHTFQKIAYEAVASLFEDPDTESGLNVFLDARNDDDYEEGHIPGAVQCYPYEVDQYWDDVAPLVEGAMKIVVYCGGGDCDDSIFMCRELQNQNIPHEAIYLYEGGWREWTDNDGPVETGRIE